MDKSKDFYTRFPTDTHAADARKEEFELTGIAVRMGATNQMARLDAEEKVLLADPNLSEDDRFASARTTSNAPPRPRTAEGEA